jgi:hypothetical protein
LDRFKTQLQKAQAAIKNLLAGGQLHEHAQIPALNAASTSLDALSVEAENLSTQALDRLIAQLQAGQPGRTTGDRPRFPAFSEGLKVAESSRLWQLCRMCRPARSHLCRAHGRMHGGSLSLLHQSNLYPIAQRLRIALQGRD